MSSSTLAKALQELLALGFIVRTRDGGVERGSKVCSLYGFTDLPIAQMEKLGVEKRKAGFDYRDLMTIAEAEHARETGMAELHLDAKARKGRTHGPKKRTLRKLKQ